MAAKHKEVKEQVGLDSGGLALGELPPTTSSVAPELTGSPSETKANLQQAIRQYQQGEKEALLQLMGKEEIVSEINAILATQDSQFIARHHRIEELYKEERTWPAMDVAYDERRLHLMLDVIVFANDYLMPSSIIVAQKSSREEADYFLSGLKLLNQRRTFEHIGFTIAHLSGEIRGKFINCLPPKTFRWETLEQLAGLMKVWPPADELCPVISGKRAQQSMRTFFIEYVGQENIIEEAIDDLTNDLGELRRLVEFMLVNYSVPELPRFEPISLPYVTVLTRRIGDTRSLFELLKLSNTTMTTQDYREVLEYFGKQAHRDPREIRYALAYKPFVPKDFSALSKIEKHAFLRRLQKIGELLTGKNISQQFLKLAQDTVWEAFRTIRDGITHQEEPGRKRVVQELLKDKNYLNRIYIDLNELFSRLSLLVCERVDALPFDENHIGAFWREICRREQVVTHAVATTVRTPVFSISKERVKFFIDTIRGHGASDDIALTWIKVFNGNLRLNQKDYGELLQKLPASCKRDKKIYKELKSISAEAMSKARSTLEERETRRLEQRQVAKARDVEKQDRLLGLEGVRAICGRFIFDGTEPHLSPIEQIDSAIEALENVKQFIIEDEFIRTTFSYPNKDVFWEQHSMEYAYELWARMLTKPELYEAIEYNAGQLLQHMDRIVKFPVIRSMPEFAQYSGEAYEHSLRPLRNYIEHGQHLLDTEDYDPAKPERNVLTRKQHDVPIVMITFIIELLPVLKNARELILRIAEEKSILMDFNKLTFVRQARQESLILYKEAVRYKTASKLMFQGARTIPEDSKAARIVFGDPILRSYIASFVGWHPSFNRDQAHAEFAETFERTQCQEVDKHIQKNCITPKNS